MTTSDARFRQRYQTWTEFITSRGHIAWSDAYTTPRMSAWCIHQRYCRLNLVTGRELIEPMTLQMRASQPRDHRRSFLQPENWLPAPRRMNRSHDGSTFAGVLTALRGAGLTRWAGPWTFAIADDDSVRLCLVCRALGYQSIFAQITGIARCPIHGSPYQSTCDHCGGALPPFRFELHGQPTKCGRCGTFLLGPDEGPQEFSLQFRQRENDALSSFAAWLECVQRTIADISPGRFPRRAEEDEPPASQSRFLHAIVPLPHDLQPYLIVRPATIRSTRIDGTQVSKTPKAIEALNRTMAADRRQVFASIRRYILRRYLYGHRECLRRARNFIFVMNAGYGIRYALREEGGCHTAQAYVYWVRSFRSSSRAQEAAILMPSPANSDIRVWAHEVLDAFHERFIAMRLSYRLEFPERARRRVMSSLDPEVCDVLERLELQDGALDAANVVISLWNQDTVVIGRGPHPELAGTSCTTCKTRHAFADRTFLDTKPR